MEQKRILVTGAAGFIGFHTARALKDRGDFVIGLDNFNTYYSPELKRARVAQLDIPLKEADLCERSVLRTLVEEHQITHILHLAAQAGVRYARKHPDAYLKSNLEGFLSILETCRHAPEVKLIYASSSSVYGNNEKIPFSVHDVTDLPANLYAATKKANELMAYSYHHLYGIPCTGLRYFTVYGPWGRPDMAYFAFSESILNGKPIRLFNEGNMERDFTYIDDAVVGTIAALDLGAAWDVFNIGNNSPVKLLDFVELLETLLGKKAEKIFEGPSKGEVPTTFAEIDHSQERLGFSPTTPLEVGLPQFVKWFTSFRTGQTHVAAPR